MVFDIITLFPDMFSGPFDQSILRRAQDKELIRINYYDLRKYAVDDRGTVDDRPYGGGVGMILMVEPIFKALKAVSGQRSADRSKAVLMDPRGVKFTQEKAREYAKLDQITLVCGRYEGVDERVRQYLVDESVSIGDYVLTGGELPAMVIVDAVTRLIPSVLEKPEAIKFESFSGPPDAMYKTTSYTQRQDELNLEHAQYTRPEEFHGWKVPEVLLSGNHREIKKWRGQAK